MTNPLSDTFRIYNPNKNIEDRDSDLNFIYYWVPELQGYSLSEILSGAYLSESLYPEPILDWAQTRKVNGKIISKVRSQVKQRLLAEQGQEYQQAAIAKSTVEKYWEVKNQQYQTYKQEQSYSSSELI